MNMCLRLRSTASGMIVIVMLTMPPLLKSLTLKLRLLSGLEPLFPVGHSAVGEPPEERDGMPNYDLHLHVALEAKADEANEYILKGLKVPMAGYSVNQILTINPLSTSSTTHVPPVPSTEH